MFREIFLHLCISIFYDFPLSSPEKVKESEGEEKEEGKINDQRERNSAEECLFFVVLHPTFRRSSVAFLVMMVSSIGSWCLGQSTSITVASDLQFWASSWFASAHRRYKRNVYSLFRQSGAFGRVLRLFLERYHLELIGGTWITARVTVRVPVSSVSVPKARDEDRREIRTMTAQKRKRCYSMNFATLFCRFVFRKTSRFGE